MVGEQFIIDFITKFEAKGVDDFINKLDAATKHIRMVESTVNKMSSFDKFKKKIEATGKHLVNTDGMITDMSGNVLSFDNQLKSLGGANDFAEALKKEAEMLEKTKKELKDNNKAQKEGSKNTRALRWNLLTLMFAGQSLQQTFGGMTKNMLEFAGLSAFVNAAMAMLFAPVSEEVVGAITGMFTAFSNLTEENKAALTGFIAFLGVFGAVLAIGSVLVMTVGALAGVMGGFGLFLLPAAAGLAVMITEMLGFDVSLNGVIESIQNFIMGVGGIGTTVSFMDQFISGYDWGGWGSFTNAFTAAGVTATDENDKIITDLDKALIDYGWDGTGKPWEYLASKGVTFATGSESGGWKDITNSMNEYLGKEDNWDGVGKVVGYIGKIGDAFVDSVQSEITITNAELTALNEISFSTLGTEIDTNIAGPLGTVLWILEQIKDIWSWLTGKDMQKKADEAMIAKKTLEGFIAGGIAGSIAPGVGTVTMAGLGAIVANLGARMGVWLKNLENYSPGVEPSEYDLGMMNLLSGKQTGGNIPFEGLYHLHAGEQVIPAGGGSTNSVNVVINANVANNYDVRRMADEIERYWGRKY